MGVVWAGIDRDQQRPLAIKLLRSTGDASARAQLLDRARAVISLRHPNVLPVYEIGSDGNRDFVAMELIEGECVADWLAMQPAQREVLAALLDAGRALEAAHKAGLVHRNFKLHNVLRDRDGRVRVADFGLARGQLIGKGERVLSAVAVAGGNSLEGDRPPPRNQHAVLDASLTQNGVYIGTPGYMALELWRGLPADERSDQFAFCVAVWEALVGTRPFRGETLEELEASVAAGVSAGQGTALPPGVRAALLRGLDPDPAKRWPDLGSLIAALEHGGSPRSRAMITAAAGLVAAASLLTIFLILRGGKSDPVELPVDPGDEPNALAGDTCEPAEMVFGDVWTSERRARLQAQRGAEAAVAAAMAELDQVRERWTSAYTQACSRSDMDRAASQRSRACLMLALELTGAAVTKLEAAGSPEAVAELRPQIAACL